MYPSLLGRATSLAAAADPEASIPVGKIGQSERGSVALRSPTCPALFVTTGEVTKAFHRAGCSWMQYSWSTKFVPARSERMTGWIATAGRLAPGLSCWIKGSFHIFTPPVMMAQVV